MTTRTKDKLEGILTKIFYICVPFILTGVIYLGSTIYDVKTQQQVIKTENDATKNMQEKIYTKVEQNYNILQSKADNKENTEQHQTIINKLDKMSFEFNKHVNGSYSNYIKDTIKITPMLPEKPQTFLTKNAN